MTAPIPIRPRMEIGMEARKVTADNVEQVAAWCDGQVTRHGAPAVIFEGPARDQSGFAYPGDVLVRGSIGLHFALPEWLYERDYEEIAR